MSSKILKITKKKKKKKPPVVGEGVGGLGNRL